MIHIMNEPCIQHKIQVGMCMQPRFKSVCTSAQADQNLSFLPEERVGPLATLRVPIKDSDQTAWMCRLI